MLYNIFKHNVHLPTDYIPLNISLSDYLTSTPYCHTDTFKSPHLTRLWNLLPYYLVELPTINTFKQLLLL